MSFEVRKPRKVIAATGGVALAALLLASPARADGDMWNSMLGWVGLGHKTQSPDDGTIDYTARPALVVPPKMDLPPPQTATATPQNWPHDPDKAARARADADSRRPAPSSDSSSDDTNGAFLADADKTKPKSGSDEAEACTSEPGHPICFYGPSSLINFAKGWNFGGGGIFDGFSSKAEDTSKLRVGVEPPREYLTQPPPGYRMPKLKDDDDADSGASADTDTSKGDAVDIGAPRHHHKNDSSAENN